MIRFLNLTHKGSDGKTAHVSVRIDQIINFGQFTNSPGCYVYLMHRSHAIEVTQTFQEIMNALGTGSNKLAHFTDA